jgi:hypothetical protein
MTICDVGGRRRLNRQCLRRPLQRRLLLQLRRRRRRRSRGGRRRPPLLLPCTLRCRCASWRPCPIVKPSSLGSGERSHWPRRFTSAFKQPSTKGFQATLLRVVFGVEEAFDDVVSFRGREGQERRDREERRRRPAKPPFLLVPSDASGRLLAVIERDASYEEQRDDSRLPAGHNGHPVGCQVSQVINSVGHVKRKRRTWTFARGGARLNTKFPP